MAGEMTAQVAHDYITGLWALCGIICIALMIIILYSLHDAIVDELRASHPEAWAAIGKPESRRGVRNPLKNVSRTNFRLLLKDRNNASPITSLLARENELRQILPRASRVLKKLTMLRLIFYSGLSVLMVSAFILIAYVIKTTL